MSSTMQDTIKPKVPAWLNIEAFGTDEERADVMGEARAVSESLRHLSRDIREVRERAAKVSQRFEVLVSGVPDDTFDVLSQALGVREVDELCMLILGSDIDDTGTTTEEYREKLQAKYGESLRVE